MASGANFDDYYAQVSSPSQEHGDSKTSGSKLKIKAKKPVEAGTPAESVEVAPVSPVTEKKVVQTFVPTITFEAAPKIVVVPKVVAAPVKKIFPSAPKEYIAPKREVVQEAPAKPKPAGFIYDANKNFKVRKPQTPRISFEPAPKMVVAPQPANTGSSDAKAPTGTSPNKLQVYAKTHQNAPKRGRNSLPVGKK